MKRAVVSVSGGMDSTSLLLNLLAQDHLVYILSFNYGQKHVLELERLALNINYLGMKGYDIKWDIVDISGVMKTFKSALLDPNIKIPVGYYSDENMKQTVVPNRNAIFSSIVYGKALSISMDTDNDVIIGMGVHSGDHSIYPDCRPDFFDLLGKAFAIGNWGSEKISYFLPYMSKDKYFILKDASESCIKLSLDFNLIFKNTNTCYIPTKEGLSCGKCGSCSERLEAFEKLGLKDPVEYVK